MTVYNRISRARFAEAWNNPLFSIGEVAAHTGFVCKQSTRHRAALLGLPPRPKEAPGRKRKISEADRDLFTEMWHAGVYIPYMSAHFLVSRPTITLARKRWGLPDRAAGRNAGMTLREFQGR